MSKSRDAFRTISEVSDALDTPAHVLRFWESKFSQVKPVKRAGGRRYYRPADVDLLAGIKQLLHEDGLTIKGAQKVLREQGVKSIATLGADHLASADTTAGTASPAIDAAATEPVAPPTNTPRDTAGPAQVETKSSDITTPDASVETAPETPSETQSDAVPVFADAASGPVLSVNLPSGADAQPQAAPASPTEEDAPAAVAQGPSSGPTKIDIPSDPSDNDSKAPARLFHMLQHADRTGLQARAEQIAPLLDRMQVLRDRISVR